MYIFIYINVYINLSKYIYLYIKIYILWWTKVIRQIGIFLLCYFVLVLTLGHHQGKNFLSNSKRVDILWKKQKKWTGDVAHHFIEWKYIHTYIHTYIYIYIYTYTCTLAEVIVYTK